MKKEDFEAIKQFREDFFAQVQKWSKDAKNELFELQAQASSKDTPPYPLETPVVYNTSLDEITDSDQIKLIVIGDNPGKEEQLAKNQRYLVGQSGRVANGFFAKNPDLQIDFRKNVIILNKTPVHTAKTKHLRYLIKNGSPKIKELIEQSQIWMAEQTAKLHQSLEDCQLWLVGYSELKANGIFTCYRDALCNSYKTGSGFDESWQSVFAYQHFSMNCFLKDKNNFATAHPQINSLALQLKMLGTQHKDELFTQGL